MLSRSLSTPCTLVLEEKSNSSKAPIMKAPLPLLDKEDESAVLPTIKLVSALILLPYISPATSRGYEGLDVSSPKSLSGVIPEELISTSLA